MATEIWYSVRRSKKNPNRSYLEWEEDSEEYYITATEIDLVDIIEATISADAKLLKESLKKALDIIDNK